MDENALVGGRRPQCIFRYFCGWICSCVVLICVCAWPKLSACSDRVGRACILASTMPGKALSLDEVRLAKMWYEEDEMTPTEIAKLLRRHKSSLTRLLVQQGERLRRGQPKVLSSDSVDTLVACWPA